MSTREPADRKPDLKERVRRTVFDLVRHKIKTPLVKGDLKLLVADVLTMGEGTEVIREIYGWKSSDFFKRAALQKRLADLAGNDLSRLLVESLLVRDVADPYASPELLCAVADRYSIDPKKVEADLKAADAAAAKAAKTTKTVKAATGKKPATSGSAAKKKSVAKMKKK